MAKVKVLSSKQNAPKTTCVVPHEGTRIMSASDQCGRSYSSEETSENEPLPHYNQHPKGDPSEEGIHTHNLGSLQDAKPPRDLQENRADSCVPRNAWLGPHFWRKPANVAFFLSISVRYFLTSICLSPTKNKHRFPLAPGKQLKYPTDPDIKGEPFGTLTKNGRIKGN